jgi:hypothetical protein
MSLQLETKAVETTPPSWRAAPSPVAVLRAIGWLSAADAAHPKLRIDHTKSSHEVFRVMAPDGRCVVVKQVPHESGKRGRLLNQELFMYRLTAWMPKISALLPPPIFMDEARQLLVVHCDDQGTLWPDPANKLPLRQPGVASRVARTVAQLHSATAQMGLATSPAAGVLGMATDVTAATQGRRAEVVELMQAIVGEPVFKEALSQGLAQYEHGCIIHGDLRVDNWIKTVDSTGESLKLIDMELAGSGDPAWDVGSLLAQVLIAMVYADPSLEPSFSVDFENTVSEILLAYFDASVKAPLNPQDGKTWHKLVLYTVARLLHVATECADQGGRLTDWPVSAFLHAARGMAVDLVATAAHWRARYFSLPTATIFRHSRESGNPCLLHTPASNNARTVSAPMDSRFRGNDGDTEKISSATNEVNASLDRLVQLVSTQRHEIQNFQGEPLADWLYLHWYVTPAVPFEPTPTLRQSVGALVRAALESHQHWETGWVALAVTPGQTVLAGRGAQQRWLAVGDHANLARPGAPVVPGDGLATFGLLTWVDAPTGFQGLRPWRCEPAGALVRVYFSVDLPALPRVLNLLVAALEEAQLNWSLKCPSQAAGYGRVDSLVVYLERAQWVKAKIIILNFTNQQLTPMLRNATPPLTCPLAKGVAFAQDPQNGQSFGQSRCLALAVAVQAHLQAKRRLSRRALKAALRHAHMDPCAPWLCQLVAMATTV